jgi:aminopeptidase-like protein
MNIDDLKQKVKTLEHAKDAVEYVLHYISEAEEYCSQVGIDGSHHGEMEYSDVLCRIEDELNNIEDALELLGVTL